MRRWASGTRASSSVRSVPSRSWVVISTRSGPSIRFEPELARRGGEVLARQLQQHLREMLPQQLPRGALGDDAAAVHDGDLIAQQLRLLHVVGREDDGLAARLDGFDQLPEAAPRLRVKPGGRFIEEQHRRIVDQRDGEQQALLLSAGELAAVALGELLQRAQADHLLDIEAAGVQAAEEGDALAHGEEVLQRGLLEEDAGLLAEAPPSGSPR